MPRGDGTGPMGYGPMSGRGMGFCCGHGAPGYMSGHGIHRGYRNMYYATKAPFWARYGSAVDEKSYLNAQAQYLKDQLKYIEDRLKDLDDNDEDKNNK
ncbi:hypothetical protein Thexy_0897 [Thermoanaerobacterium xylanolyticum LX-11]|uniref:DUF5320 domain-containing protein n=1 Tax=Thermoanaerobacterium xylanolyticum (strain ATCC 49914 / DSM 7097 / LX-11) TaxID=858215 RepID=F6BJG9_THEXL|nr:DUF5320 domain-containing protein [Thermoanaerobacterium xylanolyticum]AEF16937.1 hypothetical protein Thexy_0897 [Thermoanaerobacterium xylanolyticum LX-11]